MSYKYGIIYGKRIKALFVHRTKGRRGTNILMKLTTRQNQGGTTRQRGLLSHLHSSMDLGWCHLLKHKALCNRQKKK